MKLSKEQLKQIIKEELEATLTESDKEWKVNEMVEKYTKYLQQMTAEDLSMNTYWYYLTNRFHFAGPVEAMADTENYRSEPYFRLFMKALQAFIEHVKNAPPERVEDESNIATQKKILSLLNRYLEIGQKYRSQE